MTEAEAKAAQAAELLERVRRRLRAGPYMHLSIKADEIVASFLVCMDELQKMRDGKP